MNAQLKTCSKCGEVKAVEMFSLGRRKCRSCMNLANKMYREANKEKERARGKKRREARMENELAYAKKWREENHALILQKGNAWREGLDDGYVRALIAQTLGVSSAAIPSELIELKRKHLQILRAIKEKNR